MFTTKKTIDAKIHAKYVRRKKKKIVKGRNVQKRLRNYNYAT